MSPGAQGSESLHENRQALFHSPAGSPEPKSTLLRERRKKSLDRRGVRCTLVFRFHAPFDAPPVRTEPRHDGGTVRCRVAFLCTRCRVRVRGEMRSCTRETGAETCTGAGRSFAGDKGRRRGLRRHGTRAERGREGGIDRRDDSERVCFYRCDARACGNEGVRVALVKGDRIGAGAPSSRRSVGGYKSAACSRSRREDTLSNAPAR